MAAPAMGAPVPGGRVAGVTGRLRSPGLV